MALRKIVTVGDPILTKVCRPVTKFDQKLAILIEDMIETMHDANGVGLAGPQVGILRRVVVVDTGEEDLELVNPEVVEVSEQTQTGLEGCLSLPGKYGIVTRPEHVVVRAQDRYGDWYEYEGEELLARCLCMRLTIWMVICTQKLPRRCSHRRSLRSSAASRRKTRRTRADAVGLYGNARFCKGVSGNTLYTGL